MAIFGLPRTAGFRPQAELLTTTTRIAAGDRANAAKDGSLATDCRMQIVRTTFFSQHRSTSRIGQTAIMVSGNVAALAEKVMQILLIASDDDVATQVEWMLRDEDMDVVLAPSGDEGVQTAKRTVFNVILFDPGAADRSGIEFLTRSATKQSRYPL